MICTSEKEMLKKLFFIFVLFLSVTCEEDKIKKVAHSGRDKPHDHHGHHDHHDHHLYYGEHYLLKYLLFFAVKLKIVFAIVTFFTIVLIGSKVMALIYYLKSTKKDNPDCVTEHAEKIIYASPPHHNGYKYSEHPPSHHHKYESPPVDYQLEESQSHASHESPASTYEERYGSAPKFTNTKYRWTENTYNPYGLKYSTINPTKLNDQLSNRGGRRSGRSVYSTLDDRVNRIVDYIYRMDKKAEITDTTFNILRLNSDVCRKKFVCEVFHLAKSNSFVAIALQFLRSTKLARYKDKEDVKVLEECETKYSHCRLGKVS